MNIYYTEVVLESGCNVKRTIRANSKEDAILRALDMLDERRFEDAIKVNVIEDKGNKVSA